MPQKQTKCLGWLKNPKRRERRDKPFTLTDNQVKELIKTIEEMDEYTKLDPKPDRWVRTRDKALIAIGWTFFKRGNEILRLRLSDVYFDDYELNVTFNVSKKAKRVKICPFCQEINASKARFCRNCGEVIQNVPLTEVSKGYVIVTKRKTMEFPFCKYIVEWIKLAKELGCPLDGFLFAPYNHFTNNFIWSRKLTVQRFDQILQRLDPTLTSHMFRYGATEKYLRMGYSPYDLKEIGDWSSIQMPETYAKRKGLTKSQERFAKDTRMI